MSNVVDNQTGTSAVSEQDFRNGVMPRAQLSIRASQLAVEKATNKNAREFAGFELEEAIAVVAVLKDVGTSAPPPTNDSDQFIEQLKAASGERFDQLYMQAELDNHEFLRDLTKRYLRSAEGKTSPSEKETQHLATIALFAFDEHVALCTRINGEVNHRA
jgi:predicted outer membrane protein